MPHLHVLEDFVEQLGKLDSIHTRGHAGVSAYDLYCEGCRGYRRMSIRRFFRQEEQLLLPPVDALGMLTPSCFGLSCVQCSAASLAVIYKGSEGPTLAILRSTRGGLASQHTPPAVSYYLEQAARAQSVGALSAAVVMYRSALEQLLVDQGFTKGTCGTKIGDLFAAKEAGKDPKWVDQLHEDDLTVLNRLGNGAVHANGGDISKQAVIDADLYAAVTLTFEALLEVVYERPKREEERRAKLNAAAAKMR